MAPALFQNGVISLIDCTLLEEPESTEEEGKCASHVQACVCSHRRTHTHPERLGPGIGVFSLEEREDAGPGEAGPGSLEKELSGPAGDSLLPLPGSFQAPWVPGLGAIGFGGHTSQ